ncbi:Lipid A export ATP-binding/permease protein MsbA [Posidoniimonas polymericola]|uniref:Lipid A export ATP-binding/permease protein MsbA n=1 Tax=Posidoniimonas polymericola TaxID=2528002 RepID=A0A5C5YTD0_9BACT|nr:ABC transporter ATP-binding protein [Posidoniimonas polymericola]TWT78061.1 Lipid A export ATP-binding/permease protein MsbA [Posidoniimonas polymericola]
MSNFSRALSIALRMRVNVAACVATSLLVASFWALNLAAVWPIVDAVMQNMSVPQWVDSQAAEIQLEIAGHESDRRDLWRRAALTSPENYESLRWSIYATNEKLAGARRRLARIDWVRPYAEKFPDTPFKTLGVVCAAVLIGTLVKNVFRVLNVVLVARLAGRTALELRNEFYRRVLRLDMADFGDSSRGDLMTRCTSDLDGLQLGIQVMLGDALREPLKMIACFIGAAFISWRLLLLTIVVAPVAGLAISYLSKALKRANRRAMEELSSIYETLTETLGAIRVIKAFTNEPAERARFNASAQTFYRRQMKIAWYSSLVSPTTENLGVMMVVLAAVSGGYLVLNEQTDLLGVPISNAPLTHGQMSTFFAMLVGMSDPARRLSGLFNAVQRASASADRVYEIMDREPRIIDPPKPQPIKSPIGVIEFQNISFRYDPEKPVLTDVSLTVRRGETIAIVGPNGCGKSTLLNLLPRFYDVDSGAILLDGVDLRDVRLRDLRKRIGIVSQQAMVFNESVSANISYGAPAATQEQIEEAARQAYADGFIINKLAHGYDTVIGPGGNRLSGGQRQRITLARAILRDPEILILDEATSQIDVESERLIHQVLEKFTRTRTTFLITHRPSTLTLADRVVVMDRGVIDDIGTPDELLARNELFRSFCHISYRESA